MPNVKNCSRTRALARSNLSVTLETRKRCCKTPTCTVLLSPFSGLGKDIDVWPGPKPALKEDALPNWMHECANDAIAPTTPD